MTRPQAARKHQSVAPSPPLLAKPAFSAVVTPTRSPLTRMPFIDPWSTMAKASSCGGGKRRRFAGPRGP
eukprot:4509233-Pyramimonas_sp.AAC.1